MKQDVSDNLVEDNPLRWRLFAWASFLGLAVAFLFVGFPQLDFAVTNLFYGGNRAFVFNFPGAGKDMRVFFKLLFFAAIALVVLGLVLSALFNRKLLTLGFPQWLYLVACLAIGPGIVANVILKDNWGRARPFHVQEYGGDQKFTPALVRSDQCEDNCSFVSGEASSIYMMFFAVALLARRRRNRLLALGVIGGTAAGFIRIAQGGHFLSDVLFAGVLMALIAEVLHWLVFDVANKALRDQGPAHMGLYQSAQSASRGVRNVAHTTGSTIKGAIGKRRKAPSQPVQSGQDRESGQ